MNTSRQFNVLTVEVKCQDVARGGNVLLLVHRAKELRYVSWRRFWALKNGPRHARFLACENSSRHENRHDPLCNLITDPCQSPARQHADHGPETSRHWNKAPSLIGMRVRVTNKTFNSKLRYALGQFMYKEEVNILEKNSLPKFVPEVCVMQQQPITSHT